MDLRHLLIRPRSNNHPLNSCDLSMHRMLSSVVLLIPPSFSIYFQGLSNVCETLQFWVGFLLAFGFTAWHEFYGYSLVLFSYERDALYYRRPYHGPLRLYFGKVFLREILFKWRRCLGQHNITNLDDIWYGTERLASASYVEFFEVFVFRLDKLYRGVGDECGRFSFRFNGDRWSSCERGRFISIFLTV